MRAPPRLVMLGSLCVTLCSCAAVRRAAAPAPADDPVHLIVVLSAPRGARIVVNGMDTLPPAPFALPMRRGRRYDFPNPMMFEALPSDPGQCAQATMIEFDAPTPDTVRFDMHRCPPANLDLGAVYDTATVTDKPVRIWTPPARYPDRLRNAGIQGRVVVGCVIDTTGRVEPASVRVLAASHPDFGPPTVEFVLNSRFWPARIVGRKVRIWVQIPINFTIARAG